MIPVHQATKTFLVSSTKRTNMTHLSARIFLGRHIVSPASRGYHSADPSSSPLWNSVKHPETATSGQGRKFTSINQDTPYNLCFLRHGQSTWNRDNRFIGWTDTPLTDDGVLEARVAGQMLANSGMKFDEVHTSMLRRSIRTTNLVLMELQQEYLPVYKHWRLNERHYGDLVGKNKKETVEIFGRDQVKRWRRSYDEPPPPMPNEHKYNPARDPRYRYVSLPISFLRLSPSDSTREPLLTITFCRSWTKFQNQSRYFVQNEDQKFIGTNTLRHP